MNALVIASNGTDSRVGSLHGGLGAVFRGPSRTGIQRIDGEDEPRRVSPEVMLRGTCEKTRLLDLVERHHYVGLTEDLRESVRRHNAG